MPKIGRATGATISGIGQEPEQPVLLKGKSRRYPRPAAQPRQRRDHHHHLHRRPDLEVVGEMLEENTMPKITVHGGASNADEAAAPRRPRPARVEVPGEGSEPAAVPQVEPEVEEAPDPALERPPAYASKDDWVAYVVATAEISEEEAQRYTKAKLIEKYGG